MIGVALTVAFFAFFWALRDKLDMMGLKYVRWNRTRPVFLIRGIALGLIAGAVDGIVVPQLRPGLTTVLR